MADIKRKELMIAGKELNILLDPDPKIKMVGVKNEVLLKNIKDAGKLIAADDEISQEVMNTLKKIGIEIPEGVLISQGETPKEEKKDPSPKEEKAKSSDPTFEELAAAALDMNEIMGLEPAINPEGMDIEDLKLAIINECYDDKEICEVYTTDEFTKETWAVLNSQGIRAVDPKEVAGSTEKEESPKEEKKDKKSKDSKKDQKGKKSTDDKKPGVILSIIKIIEDDGPVSRKDILDKLVKLFPEREKDSMEKTIRIQVPKRLIKERSLEFEITPELFSIKK